MHYLCFQGSSFAFERFIILLCACPLSTVQLPASICVCVLYVIYTYILWIHVFAHCDTVMYCIAHICSMRSLRNTDWLAALTQWHCKNVSSYVHLLSGCCVGVELLCTHCVQTFVTLITRFTFIEKFKLLLTCELQCICAQLDLQRQRLPSPVTVHIIRYKSVSVRVAVAQDGELACVLRILECTDPHLRRQL